MGRFSLIAVVIALVGLVMSASYLVENLDAHEIMVIQDPIDGDLHVYTSPGIKPQMFGKVTKYPRRAQYAFSRDEGTDQSKRLRFNDGGHAMLSGAVSWEMPLDEKSVIEIHKKFGSTEGIVNQAVARMIDAAVYLAGPLMSSTESAGERRAELVQYINDQAEHGVYVTHARSSTIKDPVTGIEKSAVVTTIERDENGQPKRQQSSILAEFNIRLLPLSINELKYDGTVEEQIKRRQVATMEVQIAVANARRAEQDAITVAKQGEAAAAKSKWEQEVIKAKLVTEAEQKLQVAELAAKEAEQYKKQQILMGQGEAERKRLVMEADGALNPKLEAWVQAQQVWADAFAKYPGQMVPGIMMGAPGSTGGTVGAQSTAMDNIQNIMGLVGIKTAKDLALDMGLTGDTNRPTGRRK